MAAFPYLVVDMTAFLRLKKTFIFLLVLSVGLSLFTAFQSHMNNWLIFKASFNHLINGTSLYIPYPSEHHDLFKYSPTFALLMAPLAVLPAWLGATLWNLSGAVLFLWALLQLPIQDSQRQAVFWISLPEFIGSTQGFQSNIHMVALMMLFWVALEKEKPIQAAFFLFGSFFIKIFGIVAGALYLFSSYTWSQPRKIAQHALVLAKVFVLLLILPAVFIGWDSLLFQYQEWWSLLKMDAAHSYGFSLMGVVHGFTGWEFRNFPFQLFGALSLAGTFLAFRKASQPERLIGLIAVCYFMVLFNHKSESPTFVIAMMAFGLHTSFIKNRKMRWTLIAFTLGCVSLLYSDLFRTYKQSVFDVYSVKVWPFLILYPLALLQISLGIKKSPDSFQDRA